MSDQPKSFESIVAVSSIFEQVRPLQEQLAGLTHILEPVQQLAQLARVFQPLKEFETQIQELAKVLEPMHNFRRQLRSVLQQFSPLQDLNTQLDQLAVAFGESLRKLTEALEPAPASLAQSIVSRRLTLSTIRKLTGLHSMTDCRS